MTGLVPAWMAACDVPDGDERASDGEPEWDVDATAGEAAGPPMGADVLADDDPAEPVGAFGITSRFWPSHVIPVCWENPSAGDLWWRAFAQAAVEGSLQKESALTFTGWGTCTPTSKGIRIQIADVHPQVDLIGKPLDGLANGMKMNFTFGNYRPECAVNMDARLQCIKALAINLFGHAVGFANEQNRWDKPSWCTSAPQGPSGDVIYGPFDFDSMFSQCNPNWKSGILSAQDILALRTVYGPRNDVPLVMDIDGDLVADPVVWRPSTGMWYLLDRPNQTWHEVQWGQLGDIPVPGDFDGDGDDDLGVWRPSTGQWRVARLNRSEIFPAIQFGDRGDIPQRGHVYGDFRDAINVWRPTTGEWFTRNVDGSFVDERDWGQPGDIPLIGDFNGDGHTDPAVWRFSNLRVISRDWFPYYILLDAVFGQTDDRALAGQFGGDSRSDLAMWSPITGVWSVRITGPELNPPSRQWGQPGDIPLVGDYDGNGKAEYVVYRPSTAAWLALDPSTGQITMNLNWGEPVD